MLSEAVGPASTQMSTGSPVRPHAQTSSLQSTSAKCNAWIGGGITMVQRGRKFTCPQDSPNLASWGRGEEESHSKVSLKDAARPFPTCRR